jgi:predicted Zn-dependent protease
MLKYISKFHKAAVLQVVFAAAMCCSTAAAAAVELPDIGDPSRALISPDEERRLGQEFMRNVRQSLTILDDPEISEYVQSVGNKLVGTVDNPEFEFHFFVVVDPTINAFAGPGGYIGVDSGLILITQSESELAAVLAHETGHVTQHHLARAIADTKKFSLPTAAGLIAAIILGTQNPEIGQAALAATAAGSLQHQINFTRANEEEADRVGEVRLARAGFDPRSMADFFERMQRATRLNDNNIPALLQDHPVTQDRIAEARARADQLLAAMHGQSPADPLDYLLMRAKLRVLTEMDTNTSVNYFESKLQSGGNAIAEEANRYGYAEALMAAGRYDEALATVHRLLQDKPNKIAYLIAEAEIELGAGKSDPALQIFVDALKLYPHSHALTVSYAQALLQSNKPQEAVRLLRQHMRTQSPTPELYNLLARAEGESGDAIEAHQSLAEYYYLCGQTRTAIDQLNIALSLSKEQNDPFQTPRIKARLEQLKSEAKAEADR